MTEPSPAYFQALKASQELHRTTKKFNGRFLLRYVEDVESLIAETGSRTMLDYGCGKGVQWSRALPEGRMLEDRLGVRVTKYDPAWPPFAAEPHGRFDIVICTQVLGSIPVADLPWAMSRLYGFADRAVYIGERLKPVRKQLHAHMKDQMPHDWTHEQWAEALGAVPNPNGVRAVLRTHSSLTGESRWEDLR